ncbi:MBOAT family protein [Rubritalea tangerina]|uniref:MBOAT family protein n=2 Tax=Rubritalea tangerina TaxID=430798 RepID=A0ABW4Z6I1_9BACT
MWDLPRWAVWGLVIAIYMAVHVLVIDENPFLRMVALCSVLMAGMKAVVYSEWRRGGGGWLRWRPYLYFVAAWFGMDPRPWEKLGRVRSEWKKDMIVGLGCLICGVSLLFLFEFMEIAHVIAVFIALSMAFHFGVLRVLTGYWRSRGVGVRALFRNPLEARGFGDFWGKRWNLAYSQMMAIAVQRPLEERFGRAWAVFTVFVISGLFHELAITVPVGAGYGLPTLFFTLQGGFVALERTFGVGGKWLCLGSLVLGIPVLFPPAFVDAVILPVSKFLTQWI